jgi:hypothetical protein
MYARDVVQVDLRRRYEEIYKTKERGGTRGRGEGDKRCEIGDAR